MTADNPLAYFKRENGYLLNQGGGIQGIKKHVRLV